VTAPSSTTALEAALRARGLLPDPGRSMPEPAPGRPWFVSALLGLSGWLAGLFVLGVLGITFRPSTTGAFAVVGLLFLAGAFVFYRLPATAFVEQVALAFSMAGHLALAVAVGMALESAGGTAAAVAVFQAIWILLAPNRLARVLATFFGCVAAGLAVQFALAGDFASWPRQRAVAFGPAVAGWLAAWGPVALLARTLVVTETHWMAGGSHRLSRPVLTGLLLALALGSAASHPLDGLIFWSSDVESPSNWLVLWPLLSMGAALLALWLAHRLRDHALMGVAIAGALLDVFHLYMLVGVTLLAKSAILAGLGALLLGGSIALERRGRPP